MVQWLERPNAVVQGIIGKLPTRCKVLGPVLPFSLPRLVRCVNQSVSQSYSTTKQSCEKIYANCTCISYLLIGGIGSDTLVDCETAKPENKSAGPGPCKGPSERRSPRHDWEIAHQKQSSGTGLTIFPA